MTAKETLLTPELAATLLANAHPKQRRISRSDVARYTRTIRDGNWTLSPDPILVAPAKPGETMGQMFNGGHRCAAVIAANRAIPVLIDWDADIQLFDVIDVGRKRSASQFVSGTEANTRAAAARILLWYEKRFEQRPQAQSLTFDLHEIIARAESVEETFDDMLPAARELYEYTRLSQSCALAAFTIASSMGYQDECNSFVKDVADPSGLEPTNPARLLSDRFRKMTHRLKRRQVVEDWTLLVRSLNMYLEGKRTTTLYMTVVWPRVLESELDYRRRSNTTRERLMRTVTAARKTAVS